MTYDDLVRFAAGKLQTSVAKISDHYCRVTPFNEIIEEFDLTSPELFLKGLGAFEESADQRWE